MLLDTPSLYFRAFYGVPESITAPDGTPVNAVRGLLDMIARLVRDRSPHSLVACMDADWRPRFRVDALDAGTPGVPNDRFVLTLLTPNGLVSCGGNLRYDRSPGVRLQNDLVVRLGLPFP